MHFIEYKINDTCFLSIGTFCKRKKEEKLWIL